MVAHAIHSRGAHLDDRIKVCAFVPDVEHFQGTPELLLRQHAIAVFVPDVEELVEPWPFFDEGLDQIFAYDPFYRAGGFFGLLATVRRKDCLVR